MSEKIKTRIQLKNDTEQNWSKATNFIPKQGELIIYNDELNPKLKVGDNKKVVGSLPFIKGSYVISGNWENAGTEGAQVNLIQSNDASNIIINIPPASKTISGIINLEKQRFKGLKILETPGFSSAGNRFLGYRYYTVNDILAGEHYYDTQDSVNIAGGQFKWLQYSPNEPANTETTGYYEAFQLPAVDVGRTKSAIYNILTTKDYSQLDERYIYKSGEVISLSRLKVQDKNKEAQIGVNYQDGALYLYSNYSTKNRGLFDIEKGAIIQITESSADFLGNATTATKLQASRTISLDGDILGSTAFNGETDKTITTTISRDNRNWADNVSPIDRALFHNTRPCRTAFTPANAIQIEYTVDGTTWKPYGEDEDEAYKIEKRKLFAMKKNASIFLGKALENGNVVTENMGLRVTIAPIDRYSSVDTFFCFFRDFNHKCSCTIEASTVGEKENFTIIKENIPVKGYPGYNEITFPEKRYGGPENHYNYKYRFTFKITGVKETNKTNLPQLLDLRLYGLNDSVNANSMMYLDHIYDWDIDQNVSFPAKVIATSFEGKASSAAKWDTPIALKIGDSSRAVDGFTDISWPLDEIGAVPLTTGIQVYSRSKIGISPNFDDPGVNGLFEVRPSSETTGETGIKPYNSYGPMLSLKTSGSLAMLQIAGAENSSLKWRSKQHTNVTMNGVPWRTCLDDTNYTDYAISTSGGVSTGTIRVNNADESRITVDYYEDAANNDGRFFMYGTKTSKKRGLRDTIAGEILQIRGGIPTNNEEAPEAISIEFLGNAKTASKLGTSTVGNEYEPIYLNAGSAKVCTNPSLLVDLNSTSASNIFASAPRPGITGTLPIGYGGTGANSSSGARANLGITSGTVLPASGAVGDIFFKY